MMNFLGEKIDVKTVGVLLTGKKLLGKMLFGKQQLGNMFLGNMLFGKILKLCFETSSKIQFKNDFAFIMIILGQDSKKN